MLSFDVGSGGWSKPHDRGRFRLKGMKSVFLGWEGAVYKGERDERRGEGRQCFLKDLIS